MASVDASRPALEAVDNYGLDDLSDDPFRSPSPPAADSKKRKEPDSGLGIDKEVSVQKRARVPNVKLDEAKLLGPNGIPNLRRRAAGLKIKGKGHELWLDDLFPKARFLDALAMVEKLGHKKQIITARNDWISEGRPGRKDAEDSLESVPERPKTPPRNGDDDGVPDDDDIWGATPKASRAEKPGDEPDDDDLAALMAEAESQDAPRGGHERPAAVAAGPGDGPEDDDLDALMAEAAEQDAGGSGSSGKGASQARPTPHTDDFADEEAAMQELEGLW